MSEAGIQPLNDAEMARTPIQQESIDVPTRYGSTHLNATGPPDAPPLFLIPAMGVTSAMWLPNVAALSRENRTYVLDTIGDLGKSTLLRQDLYPKNGQAYSQWLVDVLDGLGISQPSVVGASMGGWIAMNHAIYAPDRVNRIVLIGPMGLPSWWATMKVLSHLWSVFLQPTQSNIDKTIQWALGDDPSVRRAFAALLAGGVGSRSRIKLAAPLNISTGGLRRIRASTLLILGERDNVIGNADEVAKRAKRLIPRVQVAVISGAGHMMSTEAPEAVNAHVLRFLKT